MELKNFFAQDMSGNVISSPIVYLYQPGTTTLATGLKDEDGNALTNPFTGAANGHITVAAPDGDYDMRVVGAGRDTTMRVRFIDSKFNLDLPGFAPRPVDTKLSERISVADFGAIGDGEADDTASFSAAAQGVQAAVNIVGAEAAVPRAPMCRVYVPAGTYLLTSEVNTGNREVLWELDQAARIIGHSFINGEIIRVGQHQNDYHHGTTDYACTYSIRANTNLDDGAEVLGITDPSQLATYTDRDSVGLYVDNASPAALVDVSSATYTATTVTFSQPSTTALRQYRRGMIIDTKHSPKWSGIVDSWSSDGAVLTVTAWYQAGGGGTPGTPPNGAGCVVNGFTKVWAHNANVFLTSGGYASSASGFELGMFNSKGDSSSAYNIATNRCWGFDSVNLGTYKGQAAFISRGAWRAGFYANGQDHGFRYRGSGSPFVATNDGEETYFTVNSSGSMEIGAQASVNTPFIDFHSSGLSSDYDARIIANGGDSQTGKGNLTVFASRFRVNGDSIPNTDNVFFLGGDTFRWAGVYTQAVQIGRSDTASTPFIDFNSSGNNVDYDVRLIASGGSAASGSGTLRAIASLFSTSGGVLTGATSQTPASAGTTLIEAQSSTQPALMMAAYKGNDATGPIFHFVKDRANSNVQIGDGLGQIRFEGAHSSGYRRGAAITVAVDGTPSGTSMPGALYFQVTKADSISPTSALIVGSNHHISAGADNVQYLGTPTNRWSVVYAGTGTINTSDAREKQDISDLDEIERRVAVRLKSIVRKFRFCDAVEKKGDNARIHVGVIAQDVISAFSAEGLDAKRYALLCYDEWDEQQEILDSWDAEYDQDGNLLREAGSEVLQPYRSAGNRYGVRYEELLAFIIAAL